VTPLGETSSMRKNNSLFMEKKKLLSPSVKTSNGLKPYEQWKENCVTQQETVVLGEGKRILNVFD